MARLLLHLVEDSLSMRQRLRSLLADVAGAEVIGESDNAADALRAIAERRPDLLVLDLRIRHGSGIEVLRLGRQRYPELKIAILTSHEGDAYRRRCGDLGADFYFNKTTELDAFIGVVKALAGQPAAMAAPLAPVAASRRF